MRKTVRWMSWALLPLVLAWGPRGPAASAEIQDAESATHAFEAASYQVIDTYDCGGFKIVQYNLAVLSHFSYLLVSDGQCLIVDPGRDVTTYVDAAEKQGAEIKGVFLTHSHADFVAGHTELARLGIPIYISAKAGAEYEHQGLEDGQTLTIGKATIKFLATPGHTPDSMCGLVAAASAPDKPLAMFTGDTLFVGSVGRPDLLGEGMAASTLAGMMYDTWTDKLSKLPDEVRILPAHGAGSLCGAHLSDEPSSTIGQQRVANPYFRHANRSEFIAAVLDGLPEAPQYFKHNAEMNRQGPPPVGWNPDPLPSVEPSEDLAKPDNTYVIDIRDAAEYAAGHIPNSVNIGLRGRFETWTGIMVPWDQNEAGKVVVFGPGEDLAEAIHRLHRVGYEAKALSVEKWKESGLAPVERKMTPPRELYQEMQGDSGPLVVDVRLPSEWMGLRIGTVINIPLSHLAGGSKQLDRTSEIVTVCNSAYRSSLAVGVLERAGFDKVSSMQGGSEAWIEAGLPVFEARAQGAVAAQPQREDPLPEAVPASYLNQLMMDRRGSFTLVDIRPADQFADYHLPGSENVDPAELLENAAYLTGVGPLVIVDRNGTRAMMAAGILAQKTERRVLALSGGLQAYWAETQLGAPAVGVIAPGSAAAPAPAPSKGGPSLPPPSRSSGKPKRRSAGC